MAARTSRGLLAMVSLVLDNQRRRAHPSVGTQGQQRILPIGRRNAEGGWISLGEQSLVVRDKSDLRTAE